MLSGVGRLEEAPPPDVTGPLADATAEAVWEDPVNIVNQTVKDNRVVVFGKVMCPYTRKAKQILSNYIPDWFCAVDVDVRPDGEELQAALEEMTGKGTVPHIFIDGAFVGGADELEVLASSGQLVLMLEGV